MTARAKLKAPVEDAPKTEPFHVKYRPKSLDEMVGQKAIVKSLRSALAAKARQHAFLFTGPAGNGKTTLARIISTMFGVVGNNLVEVDAASNSGIDDMRNVVSTLRYSGFGDSPNKMLIVDECHRLSKQAWDSLLKTVEEPPAHVYFAFCSTEPDKIPTAIVTRCAAYNLAPAKFDDLMDQLEFVCKEEDLDVSDKILELVARAADGSMRAALTGLAKVQGVEDEREAEVLLETVGENAEVIALARQLVKGDLRWNEVTKTLKALQETMPAESIRLTLVNYLNAVVAGARSDKDAMRNLDMLEAFMKPANPSEKLAGLYLAFGRVMFG